MACGATAGVVLSEHAPAKVIAQQTGMDSNSSRSMGERDMAILQTLRRSTATERSFAKEWRSINDRSSLALRLCSQARERFRPG